MTSKNSSWASLLERELQREVSQPEGEGWQTFAEIQKETGFGRVRVQRLLSAAVKSGRVETFTGNRVGSTGIVRAVWYREVK